MKASSIRKAGPRPTPRDLLHVSSLTSACRRSSLALTFHIWHAGSRHRCQMRQRLAAIWKERCHPSGRSLERCFVEWADAIFCTEGVAEGSVQEELAQEQGRSQLESSFRSRAVAVLDVLSSGKDRLQLREAFQCWSFLLLWQGQHFWHQKLREDEREVQVAFLQAQEAKVQQEQEARQLQQRVLDLEHALQERHDWTRQYEELKANRVWKLRQHCILAGARHGGCLLQMLVWSLWCLALRHTNTSHLPLAQRLECRHRALIAFSSWAACVMLGQRRQRTQVWFQQAADRSLTCTSDLLEKRSLEEQNFALGCVFSAWCRFAEFRVALGQDAASRVGLCGASLHHVPREARSRSQLPQAEWSHDLEDLLEDANSVMQESLLLLWKPFLSVVLQLWRTTSRSLARRRFSGPRGLQQDGASRVEGRQKLVNSLLHQIDRALLVVVVCAWKLQAESRQGGFPMQTPSTPCF
ncbi:unnamed protein product [Symbiodinium natans]|uniref:Uncharacterized protein n=1 Tax=Symbiodinium natans TaxID=878477 RepID=A0A812UR58_9DINO|nr:unnamed protein product [Symbiodinium natans]